MACWSSQATGTVCRLRTVGQRHLLQIIQQHGLHSPCNAACRRPDSGGSCSSSRIRSFGSRQACTVARGCRRPAPPACRDRGRAPRSVQLRAVHRAVSAQVRQRRQAHPKLHGHAPILVHTRCTHPVVAVLAPEQRAEINRAAVGLHPADGQEPLAMDTQRSTAICSLLSWSRLAMSPRLSSQWPASRSRAAPAALPVPPQASLPAGRSGRRYWR